VASTKAQPELRKISIATVRSRKEAAAIADKLSAAGIESVLVEEKSFATRQSARRQLGAVKVQVESRDVQRALQCLQSKDASPSPANGANPAQPDTVAILPAAQRHGSSAFIPLSVIGALLAALALLLLL